MEIIVDSGCGCGCGTRQSVKCMVENDASERFNRWFAKRCMIRRVKSET